MTNHYSLKHALWGFAAAMTLWCLAGCPAAKNKVHAPSGNAAQQQQQSEVEQSGESSAAKRELIKEYLSGDNADLRQFALLFILRFKLQEFRDILAAQAVDDQLAAVVLDSLTGDGKASAAWLDRYAGPQAQARWFGAVYGFENAEQFPPDFWIRALDVTAPKDLSTFCIGMARLDYEPGGPLQLDDAVVQRLEQLYRDAPDSDVLRRFSIDSILGQRGDRKIDFTGYIGQPALLNTAPEQWAGLLRHAPLETWNSLLSNQQVPQLQHDLLLKAAAQTAPKGLSFPGKLRGSEAAKATADQLALLFADGAIERFPLKQIETLKQYQTELDTNHKTASTEDSKGEAGDKAAMAAAQKRMQELTELSRGVIADLGYELSLACIHKDKAAVAYALQQAPFLPETAANAVLGSIARYGRDLPSDEELGTLARLGNRSLSYYLVLDWGAQPGVLDSDVRRQLLTSPNNENVMLGQAYGLWLKQQGLLTDS